MTPPTDTETTTETETTTDAPSEQSISDLIHADSSPLHICDDCGAVTVTNNHTCADVPRLFVTQPRVEDITILQEYDDGDPDDIVAVTRTQNTKTYHETTDDTTGVTDASVVDSCTNRIDDSNEWTYTTRRKAHGRYHRYPCAQCHDLPAAEIHERLGTGDSDD